jgi:aryl-alcohol dehydrogenase
VTGHEGAGVVEQVGPGVSGIAVGDHVVLSFDSCGTCANCMAGVPCYCETFLARNIFGRQLDGGSSAQDVNGADVATRWFGQSSFAHHAIATARNTVVVDPSLPLELLGPLGCGIQTGAGSILVALDVQPDTAVAVFGAGAVGLAAVMAAKVAGASSIVAVDLHQARLDLATELGATHTMLGGDDLVARIVEATGGGVHTAFDTTGVPAVMLQAIGATRMNGKVGLVGVQTGDLVLDAASWIGKTLVNILEGGVDPQTFIPRMISLWQDGRFPFDRLIETFPLAEINEAEQASLSGAVVKPVLVVGP